MRSDAASGKGVDRYGHFLGAVRGSPAYFHSIREARRNVNPHAPLANLIDQSHIRAVTLRNCTAVLLPSRGLQSGAALPIIGRLEGAAISTDEQSLASDLNGLCLVGCFKDQDSLSGGALVVHLGLTGQHGTGDIVGAVLTAEGGDGHGSEAVRAAARLLAYCSTLACGQSRQKGKGPTVSQPPPSLLSPSAPLTSASQASHPLKYSEKKLKDNEYPLI